MLTQDFGFSEKELHVFFSGHRGYHVHVESEAVKSLDAIARKEIVDYVCGLGFDITLQGLSGEGLHVFESLNLSSSGWCGRVARGIYDFILTANPEDYKSIGVKGNVAKAIIKNKDNILKKLSAPLYQTTVKGLGFETLKKIADFSAKSKAAQVDTVVTTDIHRLIRVPNTLHGKTGLMKVEFPISKIEDFDPFESAIAFKKGTATVLVSDAPKFKLGGEIFGPYKNQKVKLPMAAAILLVCKSRAEVVE
jgi:DNA primase small subunit